MGDNFEGADKIASYGCFKIENFTNESIKVRIIVQRNTLAIKIIMAYSVLE